MPNKDSPIRRVMAAAGGPVALARIFNCTYTAINTFERQGFLPLARAKQVVFLFPEAAELRDLVHDDIRTAIDLQHGSDLLA